MADRILIIDQDEAIRKLLLRELVSAGFTAFEASSSTEAVEKISTDPFDITITTYASSLSGLESETPSGMSVIMTAMGTLQTVVANVPKDTRGVLNFNEFITKLRALLDEKNDQLSSQLEQQELQLARPSNFANIVGRSSKMEAVFSAIRKVAKTDSTVLITGKSGTGKELVARAIHFNSGRKEKPFVAINCGAIQESLIESELFGHKKGSFTGAHVDRTGFFKAAEGGTLFLDEISEMPLALQSRLLRAIQEKEITPIGSTTPQKVDARFLAATNKNLKTEVAAGRFREDLYYRINVVEIHLPALAERKEDIPLLVDHFLKKYRREMGKYITGVDHEVMEFLINHEWKGEIRELENMIERAAIFCASDVITKEDLPELAHHESVAQAFEMGRALGDAMAQFEREYVSSALKYNDNNKEKTAVMLNVSLPTLYRRIKELGLKG